VASADASDDYFIAAARQDPQLSGLSDQEVINFGLSICGYLEQTMTTNPLSTYPGSAMSPYDVETVGSAALRFYCPTAATGDAGAPADSSTYDYHPDNGGPGSTSSVMDNVAKINERNIQTAGGNGGW